MNMNAKLPSKTLKLLYTIRQSGALLQAYVAAHPHAHAAPTSDASAVQDCPLLNSKNLVVVVSDLMRLPVLVKVVCLIIKQVIQGAIRFLLHDAIEVVHDNTTIAPAISMIKH